MKIIHIIENLDKGAVENWLVSMFQESMKVNPNIRWTFYCTLGKPGRLDTTVKELGGRIVYSPVTIKNKFRFMVHLRKELKRNKYDIMHCHHDFMSAIYLTSSIFLPIKKRITHIHNTDEALPSQSRIKLKFKELFRFICLHQSDTVVGISKHVLIKFCKFLIKKRDKVLYYGYDFSKFKIKTNEFRKKYAINKKTKLVLFLGRMNTTKNPIFALKIFNEVQKRIPDSVGVFAGEGELQAEIMKLAKKLNISNKIKVLGWYNNPAELMTNSDLFLFPRQEHNVEGFGLVVLEAQAAGLPVLTSKGVSDEVVVFPESIVRLSVKDNLSMWGKKAVELLLNHTKSSNTMPILHDSPFSLQNGTRNLLELYT